MSSKDQDLFNLAMSEEAKPLMAAVQKHIKENVDPITEEYYRLNNQKEDRWSWHPRQLELMEGAKNKAKESGLWNFFLPDSEIGSASPISTMPISPLSSANRRLHLNL